MSVTVKKNGLGIVVPAKVRRQAGIKMGDRLEFKVSGGIISIIPELPRATDDYTPGQRREIDAQLTKAMKSPGHGPFDTADAALKFLNREIRKRESDKPSK